MIECLIEFIGTCIVELFSWLWEESTVFRTLLAFALIAGLVAWGVWISR